jgi:hypothetical protein
MRYAVDTDALRDGAETVEQALRRLELLRIAPTMGPVAVGLPGGRVSDAMNRIGAAWQARVSDTRWMLKGLGAGLVAAAESYDDVERVAQAAVGDRAGTGAR